MANTMVRRLLLQINADSGDAETKLELISKQADELKAKHPELKVKLDTAEAQAKMAVLRQELGKSVKVKVEPDVSAFRTLMRGLTGKGGWGQLLGMFGGGGGAAGAAGAEGAAAGGEGLMGFLASPAGIATLAAASFPAAALATTGLGIGVGGLGAFAAYKMGANAQARITALQKQIAGLGGTRADLQKKAALQAQVTGLQSRDAGVLGVYSDVQGAGSAMSSIFSSAITGGGKKSFASSLAADLGQVAGFVRTLGPGLRQMFQASEPYIKAVVTGIEGFAKTVMPAITSALTAFAPHLKGITRMFQFVSDAVGGVIRAMGWMAKGFADLVNWISKGIHKAVPAVEGWAKDFARYIYTDPHKWIMTAVADVGKFPGMVVHALSGLAGKLFSIGKDAILGLIHGIEHMAGGLIGAVGHIASLIPSKIKSFLHIGSPSKVMHGLGQNIVQGLIDGMTGGTPGVAGSSARMAAAAYGGAAAAAAGGGWRGGYGGRIQLEFVGADTAMATALKKMIRVRGGDPGVIGR